eukprot:3699421-Pyramimonas_sp.AAC.1
METSALDTRDARRQELPRTQCSPGGATPIRGGDRWPGEIPAAHRGALPRHAPFSTVQNAP